MNEVPRRPAGKQLEAGEKQKHLFPWHRKKKEEERQKERKETCEDKSAQNDEKSSYRDFSSKTSTFTIRKAHATL